MVGYKKALFLVLLSFVSMNAVAMSVRAIRAVSAVGALAYASVLEKEECDESKRFYDCKRITYAPIGYRQQKRLTATLNSYGVYPKNLYFIEREPQDNALAWAYGCVDGRNLIAVPFNFCTRQKDSDKVVLLHEAGHIFDKHSEKSRRLNVALNTGSLYVGANVIFASIGGVVWGMKGLYHGILDAKLTYRKSFNICTGNMARCGLHGLKHYAAAIAVMPLIHFISKRALGRYAENYADDFARKHCIWANDQKALRSYINNRPGDPSSEKYWYYSQFKSEYCAKVKWSELPKGIKEKLLEDRNWAQFANKHPNLWRYAIQPAVDPHDIPFYRCKKHAEAIKQAGELRKLVRKVHGIGMMKKPSRKKWFKREIKMVNQLL